MAERQTPQPRPFPAETATTTFKQRKSKTMYPPSPSYRPPVQPGWDARLNPLPRRDCEVRVRGTMYLWGSAGITTNVMFHLPLLLEVHNDISGEPVTVGTETATGVRTTLGTLQPGERYTISIQASRGVFATCALESRVSCYLHGGEV